MDDVNKIKINKQIKEYMVNIDKANAFDFYILIEDVLIFINENEILKDFFSVSIKKVEDFFKTSKGEKFIEIYSDLINLLSFIDDDSIVQYKEWKKYKKEIDTYFNYIWEKIVINKNFVPIFLLSPEFEHSISNVIEEDCYFNKFQNLLLAFYDYPLVETTISDEGKIFKNYFEDFYDKSIDIAFDIDMYIITTREYRFELDKRQPILNAKKQILIYVLNLLLLRFNEYKEPNIKYSRAEKELLTDIINKNPFNNKELKTQNDLILFLYDEEKDFKNIKSKMASICQKSLFNGLLPKNKLEETPIKKLFVIAQNYNKQQNKVKD